MAGLDRPSLETESEPQVKPGDHDLEWVGVTQIDHSLSYHASPSRLKNSRTRRIIWSFG